MERFGAWFLFFLIMGGGLGIYFFLYSSDDQRKLPSQDLTVNSLPVQSTPTVTDESDAEVTSPPKQKMNSPNDQKSAIQQPVEKVPSRYPPGLASDSVYFEVIEGGFAVMQGDVLLGKVKPEQQNIKQGAYRPSQSKLWPSEVIPYAIKEDVQDAHEIEAAIDYFHRQTPIRFVQATQEDENAIVFVHSEDHCASYLGMAGGLQPIMIAPRCGMNEIMHEIMHALGFVHEHSRLDRDKYLDVLWENIKEDFFPQFNIVPDQLVHNYTGAVFNFDPESIMLYPPNAFAKAQGLMTLKSKGRVEVNPSVNELSRMDKERLYYLYGI